MDGRGAGGGPQRGVRLGRPRGRGPARPLSQALTVSAVSFQIEFTPEQIEGEWASRAPGMGLGSLV